MPRARGALREDLPMTCFQCQSNSTAEEPQISEGHVLAKGKTPIVWVLGKELFLMLLQP